MGSPVPPTRYFEALGLSQYASEAAVITAYHRLSEQRQKQAEQAYKILRAYHCALAQDTNGEESAGQGAETAKGREDLVPRPPLRYFTILGLGPGAGARQAAAAAEILSQAIQGDQDEERLSASIQSASSVFQSYFRRRAEAEAEAETDKAEASAAARVQAQAEAEAESAIEAEELAASFNGPVVVRVAYEKLGITPGTFIDEVNLHVKMLLIGGDVPPKLVLEYDDAAVMISRYWDKLIGECVEVQRSSDKRMAKKTASEVTYHPLVTGYMKTLHLAPGASLEEMKESYLVLKIDPNIDEVEKQRADQAYKFMKRFLTEAAEREARQARLVKAFRHFMVGSVVIFFLALVFVSSNFVRLRSMTNFIESGDELYNRQTNAYFGRVVSYDEEHQFRAGAPTPAFLVLMASTDSEVWVSADYARKSLLVSNENQ